MVADSDYLYAQSGGVCYRSPLGDIQTFDTRGDAQAITEAGYDFTSLGDIKQMHVAPDGSLLFAITALIDPDVDGLVRYFIYRSTDGGDTFGDYALRLGWDGAAHQPSRRPLGKHSFANIKLGDGTDAVLMGEYTTTDEEKALRVHISTDHGATWATMWAVNTGLTENFRHVHSVYQNPYNQKIMVCLGDTVAAMIQGAAPANAAAASGAWTDIDNASYATIAADGDYTTSANEQKYRAIDVAFRHGLMIWGSDTNTNGEIGVWNQTHDLSGSATLVLADAAAYWETNFDGVPLMLELPNGKLIVHEWALPSSAPNKIQFWGSGDGISWAKVGHLNLDPARSAASDSFTRTIVLPDGRIIMADGSSRMDLGGVNENPMFQAEYHSDGTDRTLGPLDDL